MADDNETTQENRMPQEETLLALLESATKSPDSPSTVLSRRAYQQRLRTFRPATYFAKPASISPLICARFGWTNPSQDVIVCEKCQAVVAIAFHPLLKAADEERITKIYREKLCTAHKVTCVFHANVFPRSSPNTVVPSYLGSVLPHDVLTRAEQLNPKPLLQKQVKDLLNAVGEGRRPPDLSLPEREMERVLEDGAETTEMFVSRVSNALGFSKEDEQWASILALLCWEPADTQHSNDPVVILQCPVCLAQRELHVLNNDNNESSDDSSVDVPPPKKQRTEDSMNPIASHRHYCPVIHGFPENGSTVPLWQTILKKLFRQSESAVEDIKGEEVMMNVHRLLKSSLK